MIEPFDYKTSERQINRFTNRVVRRLQSISQAILGKQDIEQELWVAWCKARDSYDCESGVPWQAYLQRGMMNHINRVVEKNLERFSGQTFAFSLEAPMSNEEGDGQSLSDIVPSDDMLPSEQIERESNFEYALSVLSDQAKTFVSILKEPPVEVLNEVQMGKDKAEFASKIGAPYATPHHLSSAMIFDLMGANRTQRTKIKKELVDIGIRMSQ